MLTRLTGYLLSAISEPFSTVTIQVQLKKIKTKIQHAGVKYSFCMTELT